MLKTKSKSSEKKWFRKVIFYYYLIWQPHQWFLFNIDALLKKIINEFAISDNSIKWLAKMRFSLHRALILNKSSSVQPAISGQHRWKKINLVSHIPVAEKRHSEKRSTFDQVWSNFQRESVASKYANHFCHLIVRL